MQKVLPINEGFSMINMRKKNGFVEKSLFYIQQIIPNPRKQKNTCCFIFSFIYIFAFATLLANEKITIVKNGKPNAVIILSKNPTQAAQWAADELNSYIKEIAGIRLPISENPKAEKGVRIYVGPSQYTEELGISADSLKPQEFIIETFPNALVLLGRDSKSFGPINYSSKNGMWPGFNFFKSEVGTIYAVDDFLRLYCGVHWYLPGKIGEVVPKKKTIEIPSVRTKRKLSTIYRNPEVYWSIPSTLYWWDAKKDIAKIPLLPLQDKNKYWIRLKAGGINFQANHSFGPYVKRFLKIHPEYFSRNYDGSPNTSQLCYSSEKVVDQVIEDAVEFFKGNKKDENGISRLQSCTDDCLSIVQNDNGSYCKCENCLKLVANKKRESFSTGVTSNLQFAFVNRVAKKLLKVCPDKTISTLAYYTYFTPPTIKNFKFQPNVEVMICRTGLTSTLGYYYKKDKYWLEDVKRWSELSQVFYMWEYFLFPQNGKHNVFPPIVPHRIAEEYKKLLSMPGFSGAFIQVGEHTKGRYADTVMSSINVYTVMRLMDDKNTDVDKMLDTYYRTFFGPAENPIKNFFTEMEHIYLGKGVYSKRPKGLRNTDSKVAWTDLCPPNTLKKLGTFISEAHASALKEPYKSRVKLIDDAIYQQMKTSSERFVKRLTFPFNIVCLKVNERPKGISSQMWQTTLPVSNFVMTTDLTCPNKTSVRALYDKKNLYIRFNCINPKGKIISAAHRVRDSIEIFSDDSVEIFFDTESIVGYFHIAANALGSIYDATRRNPTWNGGFKVKTQKTFDGWQAMFTIPFSDNFLPFPDGKKPLRINFARTFPQFSSHSERFATWHPNGFHNPNNLGNMLFKKSLNLVGNPGFEERPSSHVYFGNKENGWMLSNNKRSFLDNKVYHSGKTSCRMDLPSYIATGVPTVPEQTYELSAWIKTEGLEENQAFVFIDTWNGKKPIGRYGQKLKAGGTMDWTRHNITFKGSTRATKVTIVPHLRSTKKFKGGKIWFDDLCVKPVHDIPKAIK